MAMKTVFFLLSSHIHAAVALPKSSVNIGMGKVSIGQPDSPPALLADLDFSDVSSLGLQRTLVRKSVTKALADDISIDDVTTEFADSTVLGLQQSASLRVQRKPPPSVPDVLEDDALDTLSASILGLQRKAVLREECDLDSSLLGLQRSVSVQKPVVRVSSRVASLRPPVVRRAQCEDGGRISSARS